MSEIPQGKEYLTLAEVGDYVGVKKASLYYYINMLEIKTHKFNLDKRSYMSLADANRIKEVKEKPWTAGEKKAKEASVSPTTQVVPTEQEKTIEQAPASKQIEEDRPWWADPNEEKSQQAEGNQPKAA